MSNSCQNQNILIILQSSWSVNYFWWQCYCFEKYPEENYWGNWINPSPYPWSILQSIQKEEKYYLDINLEIISCSSNKYVQPVSCQLACNQLTKMMRKLKSIRAKLRIFWDFKQSIELSTSHTALICLLRIFANCS